MEATFLKRAFGIGKGWEYQSTKYMGRVIELHISAKREEIWCPKCQGGTYSIERDTRTAYSQCTHWIKTSANSSPDTTMPMSGMSGVLRLLPPFAPQGRSYTLGLTRLVGELSRAMSLKDVCL